MNIKIVLGYVTDICEYIGSWRAGAEIRWHVGIAYCSLTAYNGKRGVKLLRILQYTIIY